MSTNVGSVVSHFPSAEGGFTTTTSAPISGGDTTVPLNSTAGYATGEIVVFVIDPSDPTKKQVFTGIMDTAGLQVTNVVWTSGTNQAHVSGATVVDYATATHISMVTKGILVAHEQTGAHKSGVTYPLPVITDFSNAEHDHADAAGGGQLDGGDALTDHSVDAVKQGVPLICMLYKSGNQSLPGASGTFTVLSFDSENFDTGGMHSNVTNNSRITIPAGYGGYYHITGNIKFSGGTSGSRFAALYKNGVIYRLNRILAVDTGNDVTALIDEYVLGVAGDYFELVGYVDGGTNVTVTAGGGNNLGNQDWTSFSACFMGAS